MTVGQLIATAFHQARQSYPDLNRKWVEASHFIGSAVPQSLLSVSIQREGELDLVLRCIEDETTQRHKAGQEDGLFIGNYLHVLSSSWIGGIYAVFFALKSRGATHGGDAFVQIFHDLELLRIPLEKHEIAKDRDLKQPLYLQKYPENGNDTDKYVYSKDDPKRAHIMPSGVTERGSISWLTIDHKANVAKWIERRWLSDRILELWRRT